MAVVRGEGQYLYDHEGRQYLDGETAAGAGGPRFRRDRSLAWLQLCFWRESRASGAALGANEGGAAARPGGCGLCGRPRPCLAGPGRAGRRGLWRYDCSRPAASLFCACMRLSQTAIAGVNNVCHVGHCHPKVVAAAAEQLATLNTNSRYLHPTVVEYARDLLSTFPAPLRDGCVFFVNSGSEANDLALRIARAHTGAHDVACVDHAYHGHLSSTIAFSPYKFDHAGGEGKAEWVHRLPIPCAYRGKHRGKSSDPAVGAAYAADAAALLDGTAASGRRVCAFFAESMLSCGGQVVLPAGYLRGVYAAVRAQGGICVADEVQVGFGRVGSHWWAFETQDVVPDIVTLGKPIGNGFPLAAVVVRAEVARSFDNGMGYFNTYGGNPVAAAVGQAVLRVVRDEGLLAKALSVGGALQAGFRAIGEAHAEIGDVRGMGLFVGAEIVKPVDFAERARAAGLRGDLAQAGAARAEAERLAGEAGTAERRDDAPPAPWKDLAEAIAQLMRERGVLVAVDGPWGNVIKLKPPMCFSHADVRRTLSELEAALKLARPAEYSRLCEAPRPVPATSRFAVEPLAAAAAAAADGARHSKL